MRETIELMRIGDNEGQTFVYINPGCDNVQAGRAESWPFLTSGPILGLYSGQEVDFLTHLQNITILG